ncbi:MAG: flagellar protein FlaG [Rheinheimera sp.]|nr:flagellar protein FlaG [Rheinheimera sp.]
MRQQRNVPPPQDLVAVGNEIRTATRLPQDAAKLPNENVAVTKTQSAPSAAELGEAVESINQFVNAQMRTLNFSVDENSGKAVVKVIDFETKDVIRQIPGEEVLKMASAIKKLQDDLGSATGLLINSKV